MTSLAIICVLLLMLSGLAVVMCTGQELGKRRPSQDVLREFRRASEGRLIEQELAVERTLYAVREARNQQCLVLRLVGPAGTGKTAFGCLLAHALYELKNPFDPAICVTSIETPDMGPFVISKTFSKTGGNEAQVLELFREANQRLESHSEGLLIILNDYNLAGQAVWAFMSAFLKQDNMKNSIVIITDDLTPSEASEYRKNLDIRITPGTTEAEALDIIIDETKRIFPKDFQELSGSDVWVPFMPFSLRGIEVFVERICNSVNHELRTTSAKDYLGRLVCDIKSREQAAHKLRLCIAERGARAIYTFEKAFKDTLEQKQFCSSVGDSAPDWNTCLKDSQGLPSRSIIFQVDASQEQTTDCSVESMEKWMSFRLFDMNCYLSGF